MKSFFLSILLTLSWASCSSWTVVDSSGTTILESANSSHFVACGRNWCTSGVSTCSPGSSVSAVSFGSGTVTCTPNSSQNTTYYPGFGISNPPGDPLTFQIDQNIVQQVLTGSCGLNSAIRSISSSGAIQCANFPLLSAVITGVAAGTGLLGGGSVGNLTLSVDYSQVQKRVTGTCSAPSAVTSIDVNGGVTCGSFINSFTSGSGFTGTVTSGALSLTHVNTVIQSRVTGTCSAPSAVTSIDVNGGVTCGSFINSFTSGNGFTGTVTSGALSLTHVNTVIQSRVSGVCPGPGVQALQTITASGGVTCTNVLTGFTDGGGFTSTITSGVLSLTLSTSVFQSRVSGVCPGPGVQAVQTITSGGTVTCTNVLTGFTNGGGFTGTVTSGALSLTHVNTVIQSRVAGTCTGAGQAITSIDVNGGATCTNLVISIASSGGVTVNSVAGVVTLGLASSVQNRVTGTCAAGSAFASVAADGTSTCNTYLRGRGYVSGTTITGQFPSTGYTITTPSTGTVRVTGTQLTLTTTPPDIVMISPYRGTDPYSFDYSIFSATAFDVRFYVNGTAATTVPAFSFFIPG